MSHRHLETHGDIHTTPQSEPMRDDQVENNAGGFVWAVDDWTQLRRFLILGSEGGNYYVGEQQLTRDNAKAVERCITADGPRVVREIVEVSDEGLAAKNDSALFALAMATAAKDDVTRKLAWDALPKVARIGTHLFHFLSFRKMFGGFGRSCKRAVSAWYLDKEPDRLAYQVVKYRQRDDWTHGDVLRLAHPEPRDGTQDVIFDWVLNRADEGRDKTFKSTEGHVDIPALAPIVGYEIAKESISPRETAKVARDYHLPREALNTEHLSDPEVWQALLDAEMPLTALIRNLATMTRVGLLKPLSEAEKAVCVALSDGERLRKSRVHPIAILSALSVYARGRSVLGRGEPWTPVPAVVDALDAAFYLSFGNVEPANKRTLIALDVSGSMGSPVLGTPGLSARDAAAAMALVIAATEPQYMAMAFSTAGAMSGWRDSKAIPFPLSARERLDDVIHRMDAIPFGGTDCALPMLYASEEGLEVDTIQIYTDNETWAGAIHPAEALRKYRQETSIPTRLVTVGMTSAGFTIADPNDPGMLDCVGLDTSTPNIINQFSRGDV